MTAVVAVNAQSANTRCLNVAAMTSTRPLRQARQL